MIKLQEGQFYAFSYPWVTAGILGAGDNLRVVANLSFDGGTCIEVGKNNAQFVGVPVDRVQRFLFFLFKDILESGVLTLSPITPTENIVQIRPPFRIIQGSKA